MDFETLMEPPPSPNLLFLFHVELTHTCMQQLVPHWSAR